MARHVLAGRWTLAVAGTHGKTTTSSVLAWILEHAGLDPGFLIGGVPGNFNVTARLGGGTHFVVEADEYDTAFFDKRAKFVHYRPRTAILNNLEHDHADIYPDVASIQWQFHQLLRMVPRNGMVVANAADVHVMEVIDKGCWTPVERFAASVTGDTAWYAAADPGGDYSRFMIMEGNREIGEVQWSMVGRHNAENALAAILAARHAGVDVRTCDRGTGQIRGRATAHGSARRRPWHHRVRRLRTSPDRDRNDDRWFATSHRRCASDRRARAALQHDEARHASRRTGEVAEPTPIRSGCIRGLACNGMSQVRSRAWARERTSRQTSMIS